MRDRTPGGLTLLLDENLSGHRIINGLTECEIPVKAQTELMDRGISDEEVLSILSKHPDCFLLTKDSDFHKKPIAKAAIIQHCVGVFIITSHKGKTADELIELINSAWNRIQKFVVKNNRPFAAKILADGRVELA